MKRKVVFGIGSILILALVGVGIYSRLNRENVKDIIKIGAILPLSGDYAEYGQNDKKGIDLAVEKFKETNPNFELVVIYEDNKGNPKDAVTAMKKMVIEKPIAIIDDAISSITLSLLPEAEKNKIVLISTGATNPELSGKSPFFFRVWNSDVEEGAFAANAIYNILKFKNTAIIYINTDYGIGLRDAFKKVF